MSETLDIAKIVNDPALKEFLESIREFEVSPFTKEEKDKYEEASYFSITISYRGNGMWAIKNRINVYGRNGTWGYEPQPSSRDDAYIAANRFTLEEAYPLAQKLSHEVRMFKMSPKEFMAWADSTN
jgi:hypothetical protein